MSGEFSKLKGWGADPEDAIARLLGDEQLYLRLLLDFGENSDIDLLLLLVRQENYPEAFRIAHSMKGASVSLGLNPLSESLSELVEYLRPYYERAKANEEVSAPAEEAGRGRSGLSERSMIRFSAKRVDTVWSEYCGIIL